MSDTLRSVYDDARTTTRRADLLAARAGVSRKEAEAFLRDEASSQINAQWKKPSQSGHNYSPSGAPAGNWQADVIYLDDYRGVNDKRKAILSVLNTTSRYAAARPLLNSKAPTVAAALEDILEQLARDEELPITVLRVDGGPEFKGATTALLASRGIEKEEVEPFTHYKLSRTDRFHRTLRHRIGEHFEREQTHRWIDALPDIIANLNETPHQTLTQVLGRPTAPADVTPADEIRIRAEEGMEAQRVRAKSDALGIIPGKTQVRLLVRATKDGAKDRFAKSQRAVWTPETYTVLSRNGPNSWVVDVPAGEVKIWPSYAIRASAVVDVRASAVKTSQKTGAKIDIAVERAKRLESRNISEEEQAAALAAPAARDKRERAPRVDYAKLARGGGRRVYTLYM